MCRCNGDVRKHERRSFALPAFSRCIEVLLGHPGGHFWGSRDLASWSIPKGLIAEVRTRPPLQSGSVRNKGASGRAEKRDRSARQRADRLFTYRH